MDDLAIGIRIRLDDDYSNPADKVKKTTDGLRDSFGRLGGTTFLLNQIAEGARNLGQVIENIKGPGATFDTALSELSAITGVTGAGLDEIGKKARSLGVAFGTGAADAVEAYKNVLSKLGPEIANNPAALDAMGKSILTLSKTMGGDVLNATEALTTAMNIYAGDLKDPIAQSKEMERQMNVMAAAAQVGSAEVPSIAESIKVAGLAAKSAGVNFEELNTLIQLMGKGAVYGSEAGTALRNTLAIMGQGEYMPKQAREGLIAAGVDIQKIGDATVPVKDRLIELSKIQGNAALISEVFGRENANAARVLMANLGAFDEWNAGVTGTQSATEQAAIVMDSFSEKTNRLKARFDDFLISVFETTKGILPFISGLGQTVNTVASIAPAFAGISTTITAFKASAIGTAFATGGMSAAFGVATTSLGTMAVAAWTAMAPLLPFIGVALALYGAFKFLSNSLDSFNELAESGAEPANGFLGVMQKIGGVLEGVGEAFSSWNGETFALSEQTANTLQKMGLLDFVLALGTWAVRVKEFFSGIGQAFSNVWEIAGTVFNNIKEALAPVLDFVGELSVSLGFATDSTEGWAKAGEYLGYLIAGTLLPVVIGLGVALVSMAVSALAAALPFIAIGAAIYGVIYAIQHWDEITAWFSQQWDNFVDYLSNKFDEFVQWFTEIPSYFQGIGEGIVNSLMDGISQAWEGLVSMLTGLLASLPGGQALIDFVTGTPETPEGVNPVSVPKTGGSMELASNTQAVAERQARSFDNQPVVVNNESRTTENIQVVAQIDGEKMATFIIDKQKMDDARK